MSNAVVFMSDEHNPRFSSPYGHEGVVTPNLQRLADTGTVYENAYCPSPLCLPSRSSFMSGHYVHEIQTYSNCTVKLGLDLPSYGAVLAQQGVHTAYVGKVDVYNRGDKLGFSEMILPGDRGWPGDVNHGRSPLTIREGSADRADGFGPHENPFDTDLKRVDAAVEWLAETAPALEKPWLLLVNTGKPHFAHYVTQELWDLYAGQDDLPAHGRECASANHPYARDLRDHFETDQFTDEQIRGLRRGHLGCVTFVDRQVGRVMDALQEAGLDEQTNVIYTSDHGEMLGKFGMWWKCSLYEDSARVPLIARGPDFRSGERVAMPVQLLDLQAELFRIFGAERPQDWHGAPLSEHAKDAPQSVTFCEYHGHGTRSGAYMIRRGDWKLIYCMDAPHLLFNLAEDPEELENLYEAHPQKAEDLEAELRGICDPEVENRRAHEFEQQQLQAVAMA